MSLPTRIVNMIAMTTLVACTPGGASPGNDMAPLSCQLATAATIHAATPAMVRLTLRNTTDHPVEVLQYFTPFEGLLGEVFVVRYQGEPIPYQGPLVKRGPPVDEDWLPIGPGGSLSAEVDISGAWDLGRPGAYSLQLSKPLSFRKPGRTATMLLAAASCGTVHFSIEE
jgi:hypothetical protein